MRRTRRRARRSSLAVLATAEMATAEVEDVAVSLVEQDYDDELITEAEIRAMIEEKVHEQATDEDIARIAHLLEEAGVHLEPGLPGTSH